MVAILEITDDSIKELILDILQVIDYDIFKEFDTTQDELLPELIEIVRTWYGQQTNLCR